MIRAWSPDDVRAAERAAMADLPDGALMARAAGALAEVAAARLAERGGSRVVVLVGRGDNGGDALYAGAALARSGATVVALHGDHEVHAGARAEAEESGVALVAVPEDQADPASDGAVDEGWRDLLGAADVVLDGLLGIGGRPGLRGAAREMALGVADPAYVVAVDLPSGTDPLGRSAAPADAQVWADETVAFGCAKPGHLLPPAAMATGRLTVVDIGVGFDGPPAVERLEVADAAALWPVPGPADDKYSRGVVGVVAGGEGYTGAPLLTVTAAVEAGAGMVRYVGPPTPTGLVRAQVPEAVIGEGRVQAWVVGPGLDAGDESEAGVAQTDSARRALTSEDPCVVDAGGLELLDDATLAARRAVPTLLTPHAGEAARLLSRLEGASVERGEVEAAPLAHAERLVRATGCTVLLKGGTTVVVDPDGGVRSQDDAPAWLATAGAGDVLAGLAGTLLAAGLSPLDAGSLAALVHGRAAHRANPGGPVRALAVAHGIPGVVADLLA